MTNTNGMKKFFMDLLSNDWERRLHAYSVIENDLRKRGFHLSEERWEHMKLLAGQIISIYFKKNSPKSAQEFEKSLISLYRRLLSSLSSDKSKDYVKTQELLVDIYDEDDDVARKDIAGFFAKRVCPKETVLFNLFHCYEFMMQKVFKRAVNVGGAC